ncbi:MAG: MltA domain-containing protein [Pseudomonadota bacterium]
MRWPSAPLLLFALLPVAALAADPPPARVLLSRPVAALPVLSGRPLTAPPLPTPTPYAALPNWRGDSLLDALPPLLASCAVVTRPDAAPRGQAFLAPDLWAPVCTELSAFAARLPRVPPRQRNAALRSFIEARFAPQALGEGLLTGYFEPQLRGRRTPDERFRTPLHAPPPELATAGAPPRAEIEAGALFGRSLELAWLAEPSDAFFLHIQGSGRVVFEDGGVLRLGYAGQNGHPYVAIGRLLIEQGAIAREAMSMQAILAWMRQEGPEAANALMRANPSYIFFRELQGLRPTQGPPGAQGVPLTPRRSVAVDPDFVPLGAPVYVATRDGAHRRLTIAQDVGGAIRGRARVDLFHGWGEEAAEAAGRQRDTAQFFVLLPRNGGDATPRHAAPELPETRLRATGPVTGAATRPGRQGARNARSATSQ